MAGVQNRFCIEREFTQMVQPGAIECRSILCQIRSNVRQLRWNVLNDGRESRQSFGSSERLRVRECADAVDMDDAGLSIGAIADHQTAAGKGFRQSNGQRMRNTGDCTTLLTNEGAETGRGDSEACFAVLDKDFDAD